MSACYLHADGGVHMRRVAATLGAAALGAVACGGGGGPLPTDATGREAPGETRDPPPGTRDDPSGPCLQCDVRYVCVDENGSGQTFTLQLSTQGGSCTASAIDYFCSGAAFGGQPCTLVGGGAFTCGSVYCAPPGG